MKSITILLSILSAFLLTLFCKTPESPKRNTGIEEARQLNQEIQCQIDSLREVRKELNEIKVELKNKRP